MNRSLAAAICAIFFLSCAGLYACGDEDGEETEHNEEESQEEESQEEDPQGNDNDGVNACEDYDDDESCDADGECHWVTATCDGAVIASGCFDDDTHPTPPPCGELEPEQCQEQTHPDGCDRLTCQWLVPGCGEPPPETYKPDDEGCWAADSCQESTDCPEGFECIALYHDPCAGADCGTCGAEYNVCVLQE